MKANALPPALVGLVILAAALFGLWGATEQLLMGFGLK